MEDGAPPTTLVIIQFDPGVVFGSLAATRPVQYVDHFWCAVLNCSLGSCRGRVGQDIRCTGTRSFARFRVGFQQHVYQ